MGRAFRRLLLGLVVTVTLLAPQPAAADPTDQAVALCTGAPHGCRLVVNATWLREGTTVPITVIGNPFVRLEVVAHLAVADEENRFVGLEEVGTTGELFTSADGVARAELSLPALGPGRRGGLVVLGTGGMTDVDVDLFGMVLPFGTRTPSVLGDGHGSEKPVGAALDLRIIGAIPGSRYRVEYLDGDDQWRDVTPSGRDAPPAAGRPDETVSITYFMPQGLPPRAHAFQLVSITTGEVVAAWEATPSAAGTPQARRVPLTAAALGASTGVQRADHPSALVRVVSGTVAGVAVTIVLVGVPLANRRARPGRHRA